MTTFNVTVHDIYTNSVQADTGRPLYAAILVAEPDDRGMPLAFHTGLISGDYLDEMRRLKSAGTVSIQVEDGFFDSDLYHQRKEIVRSAFEAAGISWDD